MQRTKFKIIMNIVQLYITFTKRLYGSRVLNLHVFSSLNPSIDKGASVQIADSGSNKALRRYLSMMDP